MAFTVVTSIAFVSGMICAELKIWKAYLPCAIAAGLLTTVAGHLLGVE